jgi:UDP-N-acetylmuramate dehydrogenase
VAETLAAHTTLRVGGPAADFVVAGTEAELVAAVDGADAAGTPVLVLGGGSNLVVADEGFPGRVVAVRTAGVHVDSDACGGAIVRVAAGESWDALAERAGIEGWIGVEALAGIPGLVGSTPIQNVGAYGQEVGQTVASVRCWDRSSRSVRTLFHRDLQLGYRTSLLKQQPGRWVVLEVVFQLRLGDLGEPVRYAELADRLGIAVGERAPSVDVRAAVLELRRSKGMVLDAEDHDTWSAGSFFTNPVVAASAVPDGAPSRPQPDGAAKTSAAWLIEHAGFPKGYGTGPARLSGKHTLALTNRGGATAADVLALARELRDGVRQRFGIELVNEPVLVGLDL